MSPPTYPASEGTSEELFMWIGHIAGTLFLAAIGVFCGNPCMLIKVLIAVAVVYFMPLLIAKKKVH